MKRLAFVAAALAFSAAAAAQTYPSRPVRIIVPFPPGGAPDIIGRLLSPKMSEALGQPVIIENRAGAAGSIGSDFVAKAAPDGYTLVMASASTHAVGPAVNPKLPYDNITDFTPITLVASFPNVLVAHPSTANSVPDLLAKLKANPGKYSFGSSGLGSSTHLTGELFKHVTATDTNHIPYKGTGPLLNDLMAGHVSFAFDQITPIMSMVRSGKLKALGVASKERNPALPDVPPIAETLPGFEAVAWVGIFGPAKLPADVPAKIQAETRRALQSPDIAPRISDLGATAVGSSPAEFGEFVRRDTQKWRDLVTNAKLKIDQ
jgi:tripartite-type tricarboxylate transporter receptor subunit TctC